MFAFLDPLVDPAFLDRRNPRGKVWVSYRVAGWIVAVVTVIGIVALAVTGVSSVSAVGKPGHPGVFPVAMAGLILVAATNLLTLAGSIQMVRGQVGGRRLTVLALILTVVCSLIYNVVLENLAQFVLHVVIRAVLYLIVVLARFPVEGQVTNKE